MPESSKNIHFNFNVLDAADLFNVFDATGYCKKSKVVLQENLYGPNENPDAPEAQILQSTTVSELNKTIIYGNGYQVNLKAKNKQLADSIGSRENTGTDGLSMQWLYNVTLKGTDPAESVSCATHKILLNVIGAYYSDLQSYSKIDPIKQTEADGTRVDRIFFKNTVMRYVANCALQLYAKEADKIPLNTRREAYFENVVIAESMRGISVENGSNNNLYIRGSFDVLNYSNCKGLQDKFITLNGATLYYDAFTEEGMQSMLFGSWIPGLIELAPNIIEWFGSNGTTGQTNYRYYINMITTSSSNTATPAKMETKVWDGKQYSDSAELVEQYKLKDLTFSLMTGLGVTLQTFDVSNTTDGGHADFTGRDVEDLFTTDRDIRLLCEYKTINGTTLVKNEEHILWHMQQVYRDMSLVQRSETNSTGIEPDHIEDLKKSLQGQDITWPDGTTAQAALDAIPAEAAALAEMVSTSVLPPKRTY